MVRRNRASDSRLDRSAADGSIRLGVAIAISGARSGPYGDMCVRRARAMGIWYRPTAARSNIARGRSAQSDGTCLDRIIVFGEQHLRHLLRCYASYYNQTRTHLSLNKDAPVRRAIHAVGRIDARPVLGGPTPSICLPTGTIRSRRAAAKPDSNNDPFGATQFCTTTFAIEF